MCLCRRSRSRSHRRSYSKSRRRSKSPRRRRSHSRDRSRHSRSRWVSTVNISALVFRSWTLSSCAVLFRDRRKEEKSKKRSKTPPKSYSSARRSRSISRWMAIARCCLEMKHLCAFTTFSVWKENSPELNIRKLTILCVCEQETQAKPVGVSLSSQEEGVQVSITQTVNSNDFILCRVGWRFYLCICLS